MTVSAEALRAHLAYSAWASSRLVEAARHLSLEDRTRDFATADRSVLGTLVHIFAADRLWAGRVEGASPTRFLDPEHDLHFSVLEHRWPEVHARWKAVDIAPDTVIAYHGVKGDSFETPYWQIVLHVVNHATHHRGQVAGFLRAMGRTPPSTDLTLFYRESPHA